MVVVLLVAPPLLNESILNSKRPIVAICCSFHCALLSDTRAARCDALLHPGLQTTASAASVRRAYLRRVVLTHPDKCCAPGAAAAFQKLRLAYDCLGDPLCKVCAWPPAIVRPPQHERAAFALVRLHTEGLLRSTARVLAGTVRHSCRGRQRQSRCYDIKSGWSWFRGLALGGWAQRVCACTLSLLRVLLFVEASFSRITLVRNQSLSGCEPTHLAQRTS